MQKLRVDLRVKWGPTDLWQQLLFRELIVSLGLIWARIEIPHPCRYVGLARYVPFTQH